MKNWLATMGTRLGVLTLWFIHLLPNKAVFAIGRALGALLYLFGRGRVTRINLKLCFPGRSDEEIDALGRQHFAALGRSATELGILWFGSHERILKMTKVIGFENIQKARAENPKQPIIMLAPHFIGLNMGGAAIANALGDSASIYSRQKNPIVDRLFLRGRLRFGRPQLLSRQDGLKPVIRAIRDGLPFYYLPDMDFGPKDSIFVPFFGVPAATVHALPRLAQLGRAKVVPVVTEQTEDGYIIKFYPAWENFPTDSVEFDVLRMNQFIEEAARPMLHQYFWAHKRFKTRPPGVRNPYKRD